MKWTEKLIRYVVQDMASENALACRALFGISEIVFSDKVQTMAVTLTKSPVLHINLDFCCEYLESENDVKAVLLHEFLHVLLLHTERYTTIDPLLNIAMDAIINAIIYRYKGMDYADFFVRFYKWEKITFLLRPKGYDKPLEKEWMEIHDGIYKGKYCADDLYELLDYLRKKRGALHVENVFLLGDHSSTQISSKMKKLLDEIMQKMDGTLIWNNPVSRGLGEKLSIEDEQIRKFKNRKWQQTTMKTLKKCLLPNDRIKTEETSQELMMPVLSSSDRRAMARFKYSGMVPFSKNESIVWSAKEQAVIYLDVSGSISQEINDLISLLHFFRTHIRMPLYVFSGEVAEASFKNGRLVYGTCYGTKIEPVFEHIRKNKIRKSLIVSDGYIEKITDDMTSGIKKRNIHVLISSSGNPEEFEKAGISWSQLERH
jgi:predicted metal-dependent peptidase